MNKMLLTGAIAFALLNFAFAVEPPAADDAFEHPLDGVWSGLAEIDGFPAPVPVVLNFNAQGNGGTGMLLIPTDPAESIEDFLALPIAAVKTAPAAVSFTVNPVGLPNPASDIAFALKFSKKKGSLSGSIKSKIDEFSSGKVTLFAADTENPHLGLWTGDNPKSFPVILQVSAGKKGLGGTVFVDTADGSLTSGTFDGKALSGGVNTGVDTWTFSLKFNAKKQLLTGQFRDAGNVPFAAKLRKAGTGGKALKLNGANPGTIVVKTNDAATYTAGLTLTGLNFTAGSLVHVDNPSFGIDTATVGKTSIAATLTVPMGVADGATVGLLVITPDGQMSYVANALTIDVQTDDGGGGGGGGGDPTVSFAADIQPIFDANCVGCHGGNGGLFLEAGSSYNNLVGVRASGNASFFRIQANNPDDSYLIMKIRGDNRAGQRMPLGGPFLDQETINKVVTWVNEGALNN